MPKMNLKGRYKGREYNIPIPSEPGKKTYAGNGIEDPYFCSVIADTAEGVEQVILFGEDIGQADFKRRCDIAPLVEADLKDYVFMYNVELDIVIAHKGEGNKYLFYF